MEGGFVVEKEKIRSVLTYSSLVDRLNEAFASAADYTVPERHHHGMHATGGTLLLMPAWSQCSSANNTDDKRQPQPQRTRALMGVKIITVFPDNSNRGLASVLGVYILSSAETGQPLALINGTELTYWRTACVSALAARYLARTEARVLVMVGAGALAAHLIQAHLAVNPSIDTVVIWNRTHDRAISLATHLKQVPVVFQSRSVLASPDLENSIRRADIVVCATLSEQPLVRGQWLKRGVHVSLVGSYKPSMRESDDEAIKISKVYVDAPEAVAESGDLCGPISRGVISKAHIVGDLADLVGSTVLGRKEDVEVTLFKSVGCGLEDLAAAQLIYQLVSSSASSTLPSLPVKKRPPGCLSSWKL